MRISDGSSDVCSSDLLDLHFRRLEFGNQFLGHRLLYALLDGDLAARATLVLKWIADIHATNIDTARREPAAQNIEHLVQLKNAGRSEEHTSELQSLMRISYAVFCLKKKKIYICVTVIIRMTD